MITVAEIERLIAERRTADRESADRIVEQLRHAGVVLIDSPTGTRWQRIEVEP